MSVASSAGEVIARLDSMGFDIGSYHTDSSLIRADLGWRPATCFGAGVEQTLAYYRRHLPRYLDPAHPNPACKLAHPAAAPETGKLVRA